jgi:hypothetical protein
VLTEMSDAVAQKNNMHSGPQTGNFKAYSTKFSKLGTYNSHL